MSGGVDSSLAAALLVGGGLAFLLAELGAAAQPALEQ